MKSRIARFAQVLPVLLAAGCGLVATPAPSTPQAATQVAPAQTAAAPSKTDVDARSTEAVIEKAYGRLTVSPGIVSRGGRAHLWLDVWSTDKKIKTYDARWSATEGMVDRFLTRDSGFNGYWAPFSPFYQNALIGARVNVEFEDGTTASGTLRVSVWIQ